MHLVRATSQLEDAGPSFSGESETVVTFEKRGGIWGGYKLTNRILIKNIAYNGRDMIPNGKTNKCFKKLDRYSYIYIIQ